ncbi:hypothetical protein [Hoeflea prorocentri]|uniref:hypothetical protein n=1 Tax=Hoeflea prorocentri TaxID=1922333 RepID=UPI00227C91AC|nr:hypothetical protein [Hoeflea prorocentri]MCY6379448.1 hypothetical protein [Hoeflea prorocentri]
MNVPGSSVRQTRKLRKKCGYERGDDVFACVMIGGCGHFPDISRLPSTALIPVKSGGDHHIVPKREARVAVDLGTG